MVGISLPSGGVRTTPCSPYSPCERRLDAEDVDHLRDGQRNHGEIDALAADRQQAGDEAQRGGAGDARQQAELGNSPTLQGCVPIVITERGFALYERRRTEGPKSLCSINVGITLPKLMVGIWTSI